MPTTTAPPGLPAIPHVEGVEHRFADVRGLRMHYAEAGAGEPLVLLHGWPQHWYCWRNVIGPLAERHRVICPDLRGHGWTDAPPDGYEKENMASDVLALLDELGVDRFHLAGHDWGGFVGFLIALREPDRVRAYLALGIIHPWQGFQASEVLEFWRLSYQWFLMSPLGPATLRRRPDLVERLIAGGAVRRESFTPEVLRAYSSVISRPENARASQQVYGTFQKREALPMARGRYRDRRLRVPTRLLYGAEDPVITDRRVAGFEGHADDMAVERLEGCGHFVPEELPDLVVSRARELFEPAP